MEIRENVPLAQYTTLGIGGAARYFCTVENEQDLIDALDLAKKRQTATFILGGGSNLFVSDKGFDGLVVRMGIRGVEREGDTLKAGAGEPWDAFVQHAVDQNLAGIECLAGIPGTVGGTPVQNVGAYGQEVSTTIERVRAFDLQTSEFVELNNEECGFAYRTSLFNTSAKGRYIVTRVDFKLVPDGKPNLNYADISRRFDGWSEPTLKLVADAVREIRGAKGMVTAAPDEEGKYPADRETDTCSAGSFFRNPLVAVAQLQRIAYVAEVQQVPNWPAGKGLTKLPAAWLIEHAGFAKGFAMGNAGISSKHTLALVNRGGASAEELKALRDHIAEVVREKFDVQLEQEPVSVP